MIKRTDFPADFVWGVATSSYQIEGATTEAGRSPSIWDTFSATPGKVLDGSSGAVACDHYHRWESDLDLIRDLGVGAYRFSVSWPRILPEGKGRIEARGLDFYERLVDGMLERGLDPWLTLYHWDLPQVLQDAGGWPNRDTAYAFAELAEAVSARLGDRVANWATLNEPWCSAYLGYEDGEHAPGLKDRRQHLQASHHLLLAHGLAMPLMRRNAKAARHGIVLNLNPAYPATGSEADARAAERFDGFFNRWYLDPLFEGRYPQDAWDGYGEHVPRVQDGDLAIIAAPLDYLGVNFYSRTVAADAPNSPWPSIGGGRVEGERTAMGWEVYPAALTELLVRLRRDYTALPIYITENGAAYPDEVVDGEVDDRDRLTYVKSHIDALKTAAERGAPADGYFAWSLMDNFEWAHGYTKRFGLVHVDYDTQRRTLKRSAKWYRDFLLAQD